MTRKPVKRAKTKSAAKPAAKNSAAKKAPVKKAVAKKKPAPKSKASKAKAPKAKVPALKPALQDRVLLERILKSLDDDKAEEIVTIDLGGRSALADAIVVASGRGARHVAAIAEHLARRLKEAGYGTRPVNGAAQGDWVLVDAGDIIVHIFRPEVRDYYDLEGMWSVGDGPRALK